MVDAARSLFITQGYPTTTMDRIAAEADPYVEEYTLDIATTRRGGMGRLVGRLAELGALRSGLGQQRATDLLFVLDSHETFLGLTRHAGWSVPSYKAWLFATLVQQLLGVEPERNGGRGADVQRLGPLRLRLVA